MDIAIIGTGNVGAALARKWAAKGHLIYLGVRDKNSFKGNELAALPGISVHTVPEAVQKAAVVLLATPATAAIDVAQSLGDTTGKILIDAMNAVMGKGPAGFSNTADAILVHTASRDLVKCFNTTGYNNMQDPEYNGVKLDLFMAGDSKRGKETAKELALDAGFENCYDAGGNEMFSLMEQFAFFWINLAMRQGLGREIGFKLLRRS